jgi:hypothetical protein
MSTTAVDDPLAGITDRISQLAGILGGHLLDALESGRMDLLTYAQLREGLEALVLTSGEAFQLAVHAMQYWRAAAESISQDLQRAVAVNDQVLNHPTIRAILRAPGAAPLSPWRPPGAASC